MDDLINRQAAIDAECEVCQIAPKKERGHNCKYYVHGCKEIECLRALPSAQSERKKGKWIPFEYGDDTWHKCTACGVADNYISIVQRPNGKTGRLESVRNYCPNCGAMMENSTRRMKEAEDGE